MVSRKFFSETFLFISDFYRPLVLTKFLKPFILYYECCIPDFCRELNFL